MINKLLSSFIFIFIFINFLIGQQSVSLFEKNKNEIGSYILLENKIQNLKKSSNVKITFPLISNKEVQKNFKRIEIFSSNYVLTTDKGVYRLGTNPNYHTYQSDDNCFLTINNNEVNIKYSDDEDEFNLSKRERNNYFITKNEPSQEANPICGFDDNLYIETFKETKISFGDIKVKSRSNPTINLYLVADYSLYQNKGYNVVNVENYINDLFVQVKAFYTAININLVISQIYVYTSPDPFNGITDCGELLSAFRDNMANGFNGDLAHLLTAKSIVGCGGIAYLNTLCDSSPAYRTGISRVTSSISTYPNAYGTVGIMTHELGHNFGSLHTHACVWNGNNTQIDDCGNSSGSSEGVSGGCYDPNNVIIPPNYDGTIMSYCSVNSNEPWNSQVINVIQQTANNFDVCNYENYRLSNSIEIENKNNYFIYKDLCISSTGTTSFPVDVAVYLSSDKFLDVNDIAIDTIYNPNNYFTYCFPTDSINLYNSTITPGNYYILFQVDPENLRTEIIETDNVWSSRQTYSLTNQCVSPILYYQDNDLDGYGNPNITANFCSFNPPSGYANSNLDCNDQNAAVNPDRREVLNDGIDNDCNGQIDEVTCFHIDSMALLALYNATNGANWNNAWDLSQPLDTWYGVTLNEDDCVVSLNLGYNNNLNGTLPPELNNMTALETLIIRSNQNLTGPIPDISNLTNLVTLNLNSNNLSQFVFPTFITNFTKLKTLGLSRCNINGTIPTSIGNLINLENLYLDFNNLTGEIPVALSNLVKLRYLYLGNNNFSGQIPEFIGNLQYLYTLSLSYNELSGEVPNSFNNLNIRYLYLNNNELNGNIDFVENLNNLLYFNINSNKFSGNLPTGLGNLQNIISINVSNNNFSGCFPPNYSNICNRISNSSSRNFSNNPYLAYSGDFEQFCSNTSAVQPTTTYYIDLDGDGYGSASGPTLNQCTQPNGYVVDNTDCNDNNPNINPGATELCTGNVDENCNGRINDNCPPCDGESWTTPNNIMQGDYSYENTIESSGIINVDSVANFTAGNSITLKPGFHAKYGSNFTASIKNCEYPNYLYWTDVNDDALYRSNINIGNSETLVNTQLQLPHAISVNALNNYGYLIDYGTNNLYGVDLNVGNSISSLQSVSTASDVLIDEQNSKIYFSNYGAIYKADLNGQNTSLLYNATNTIIGMALDIASSKIYFTTSYCNTNCTTRYGDFGTVNIDGSNPNIFQTIEGYIQQIVIHKTIGKIYWNDVLSNKINRMDLNGTNQESVISNVYTPIGLAIDTISNKLYYSDRTTARIYRCDLDGSNIEIFKEGLTNPGRLNFGGTNLYKTN